MSTTSVPVLAPNTVEGVSPLRLAEKTYAMSLSARKELGGQVVVPPTDIRTIGRFAVLTDPQGVFFSVRPADGVTAARCHG